MFFFRPLRLVVGILDLNLRRAYLLCLAHQPMPTLGFRINVKGEKISFSSFGVANFVRVVNKKRKLKEGTRTQELLLSAEYLLLLEN